MLKTGLYRIVVPVALAVALVLAVFGLTETRRSQVMNEATLIQQSQERIRLLVELQLAMTDAETGQRGYLLTGDKSYLTPYTEAKQALNGYLHQLQTAYTDGTLPMLDKAQKLSELANARLAEIDATIAVYQQSPKGALSVIRTNVGRVAMSDLRTLTADMRRDERQAILAATADWQRNHRLNRNITAAGAGLNVVLIIIAGLLVARDVRRRASHARDLEQQVLERTAELSELSNHMQQITEAEKSALARELHDELGTLLVAIKMDLSQLARHVNLNMDDPAVRMRWERIQAGISAGIDLKRRVIEQLRPTLLDNMGLVAALRWQINEVAKQANLGVAESFPDDELAIHDDAAIAIFRIVQEAMTNVVKHAQATAVRIECKLQGQMFWLLIEDNGVGLAREHLSTVGSHGISSIRHRVRSFDGRFVIESAEPSGTRLCITLPLSRIMALPPARAIQAPVTLA